MKLTTVGVKAGGVAVRQQSLGREVIASAIVPLLKSFLPTLQKHVGMKSELSFYWANTMHPALETPRHTTHSSFQHLFHRSSLPQLLMQSYLKSLEGP